MENVSLQRERTAVEHCGCRHTTNAIGEWVKYEPCDEHDMTMRASEAIAQTQLEALR